MTQQPATTVRHQPRPSLPLLGTAFLWRALTVTLLASLIAYPAQANNGGIVSLPMGGTKNRSGLRLDIDTRWVSGSGYRPVRIRVSSQPFGPAAADRTITVRLRPRGNYGGTKAGAVSCTVELKQGALFGETIVSIPQTNVWNSMMVETREDGWRHRDLCAEYAGMAGRWYSNSPDNSPAIVVVHWAVDDRTRMLPGGANTYFKVPDGKIESVYVEPTMVLAGGGVGLFPAVQLRDGPSILSSGDSDASGTILGMQSAATVNVSALPDIRVLAGLFPENYINTYGGNGLDVFSTQTPVTDSAIERLVADLPNLDLLPPNLLPDDWLDYTNIDVLILSRSELQGIQEQFPDKWNALRTWIRSGPLLVVYDAGPEFERLDEIERLLRAEPLAIAETARRRGWEEPNVNQFSSSIDVMRTTNGSNWWQQQIQVQRAANPNLQTPAPTTPQKPSFVWRPVGQGQVVAIAAENPFPSNQYEWNWIFNSVPTRHWLNYQRQGFSNYQDNMQFWAFLVEGIGRAPVKTFLAMITVFAIVIGPLNYFALQRRGRLYLLLVTVPLGAGLISGGLFLFAMLGDGFGTRLRLRSYTELDSQQQQAMTWSRQTYYAGFAPSRGLSFPVQAAVYPVEHRPISGSGMEDTRRELVWGEDQNLLAGYFSSRTMAQFVVVEPQETKAAIRIEESSGGTTPQVVNELGGDLERLVLRDVRGDLYEVLNLGVGQRGTAVKIDSGAAGAVWRTRFRTARPAFPEGFNPRSLDDVSEFFGSRAWRPASNLPAPVFETSVLETGIRKALDQDFELLKPRSFVAILPRSPFVSRGVDSVTTETGFHVVVGRW